MRKLGILLAVVLFGLMIFAEADLDSIVNRIELLEEYANMIYDAVGTKVATEDFEAYVAEMEDRIGALETELLNVKSSVETGMPAIRDMLYELSANIAAVEERLTSYIQIALESLGVEVPEESALQGLLLKVDMHDQDIVNIYDNLSAKADREIVDTLEASITDLYDSVYGLNEILTGLAAQIGDTDYLLRKQIEDLEKNMNTKLGDYLTKSELEEQLSNIFGTIEDIKVTLDIHDSDILKIYETLGNLSEQIATLNDLVLGEEGLLNNVQTMTNRLELLEDYANMIYDTVNTKVSEEDFASAVEELNANIEKVNADLNAKINKVSEDTNKKIEEANKKLDTVQLLSILGIGLGAVAIILKFVNF